MNFNNRIINEALNLNGAAIDDVSAWVEQFTKDLKMERSNIVRIRLSAEEILLRWMEHFGEGKAFSFTMGYRLSQPYISLELPGEVCNPFLEEGEQEDWGGIMLEKLGLLPRFSYERGKNCVYFQLERPRWNPALKLLVTIIAAVLIGMAGREMLPAETLAALVETILTPIYNAFLRLLNLASGPVVFLSVLAAVYEVGSMAVLGNLGAKLSARFIGLCFFFTALSAVVCLPLFSITFLKNPIHYTEFASVLDLLLNIIPSDILTPFIKGDSPSLILLAVVAGNILLTVGRRSGEISAAAAQVSGVMLRIVDGVNVLGSWVIVVVLLLHIWSGGMQGLLSLWRPIMLCAVLSAVYILIGVKIISTQGHVKTAILIKKMWTSFWIALSTGSVTEAHGENVICCEKKLGVSPLVTHYGIPLGSALYMPGVAINALLIALYMAEQWNVSISLLWVVTAVVLATVLAIAAPPISGAGLLTYAAIFSQLGIPTQALAVAMVADILMGFIAAALDQALLQMELVAQADRMLLLDKERLRSKSLL